MQLLHAKIRVWPAAIVTGRALQDDVRSMAQIPTVMTAAMITAEVVSGGHHRRTIAIVDHVNPTTTTTITAEVEVAMARPRLFASSLRSSV